MISFNGHRDRSTRFSNARSKIIVLKVGDALRTLRRGISVFGVSNTPKHKIQASLEQLAKIANQKSPFQELSAQTSLGGNATEEAMAKSPEVRRRQSAISVSEEGSPLRRGNGRSVLNSNLEQTIHVSKPELKTASDFQASRADPYETLSEPFSLSQGKPPPPFRRQVNLSSDTKQHSPSVVDEQLDQSPPSWRTRQLQLLQQLGLSTDKTLRRSSSQLNLQLWDTRRSWPGGPISLRNLTHPDGAPYTPLPYSLSTSYTPSLGAVSTASQTLLPVTVSTAFAAEGWQQSSNAGSIKVDPDDFETHEGFDERLMNLLKQMMFVSGETAEASPETTGMIEEIVRAQVIEMLKQATDLANRRGVRSISTADLIFLIRHDKAKVSRLKTFLSWKDVRKNVKDSDEKGGGDAGEVDFDDGANLPGAGPVDSKKSSNKKAKLILPWEVQSFYSEQVPERDDEEDNEEEEEQNEATLARLASADERTKNMTRDEYVYWSDCRQASFTFRKGKRFREWAGFGVVTDSKPNDDIVDILGFLTFEIVQTLTEEALKVKAAEDLHNARTSSAAGGETKKRKREGSSLFEMPEEGRTPVEPKHVREAFRRLQIVPKKYTFMRPGYMGIRQPLRLI